MNTSKEIYELAKNSFQYSLLTNDLKRKYIDELDAYYEQEK